MDSERHHIEELRCPLVLAAVQAVGGFQRGDSPTELRELFQKLVLSLFGVLHEMRFPRLNGTGAGTASQARGSRRPGHFVFT